jgi:predicted CxxxxCH...CXXCH cytochrome family protein
MKTKGIFLLSLFALVGLFWGCETSVDEDWFGFGSSAHFPAPYENDHLGYIKDNPEALTDCQNCHGSDYDGGTIGISCLDCHESEGVPSECNHCHGDPQGDPADPLSQIPNSFGHVTCITGGQNSLAVPCNTCHIIPTGWNSPGHIDAPPSEVDFSGISDWHDANPIWNQEEMSCSNTYCHGDFNPVWTGNNQAECGSCHALPPPPLHPQNEQCALCHSSVINDEGEIINPNLHINGVVNL